MKQILKTKAPSLFLEKWKSHPWLNHQITEKSPIKSNTLFNYYVQSFILHIGLMFTTKREKLNCYFSLVNCTYCERTTAWSSISVLVTLLPWFLSIFGNIWSSFNHVPLSFLLSRWINQRRVEIILLKLNSIRFLPIE